jgi:hypothetical protein
MSTALITGASSGLGEAFARKLSRMGFRLILVARRRDRLENLAAELRNADVVTADLMAEPGLSTVEKRIASEPGLELLVNNAGFGRNGAFHESPLEIQDGMHRLHIIAIERLTHAALRGMVERHKGSIINVSSVAGFATAPFSVSYSATKAWINSFTEGLHLEMKAIHSPVRVQALCPGFTYTEFHDTAGMDRGLIPRFLWMSADEVVDASLRALERGKLFVVPGLPYKLLVTLYPLVPRPLRHRLSIRYANARQR